VFRFLWLEGAPDADGAPQHVLHADVALQHAVSGELYSVERFALESALELEPEVLPDLESVLHKLAEYVLAREGFTK